MGTRTDWNRLNSHYKIEWFHWINFAGTPQDIAQTWRD